MSELDAERAESHLWLGLAYTRHAERTGSFKRAYFSGLARSAFTRTVELDPDHLAARHALMKFYLEAPAVAEDLVSGWCEALVGR